MSKKQSAEARIIEWFESAPMATAEIVLGIVRSRMKTRAKASEVVPVAKPAVRRKRVAKPKAASAGMDPAYVGNEAGATQ